MTDLNGPGPAKPLVPYHGGKGRLADWIVSLMPPHRVYVEPFAGSAAVLLAKPACTHEILNDVDGNVVNFYRVLRERPDELEEACRLTPYSREEFQAADLDAGGLDEVERARRWWIRANQSFAHTGASSTGWSSTTRRNSNLPRTVLNRVGRFSTVVQRLSMVTIENRDAVDVIERYSAVDGVIYADPPYLLATRSTAAERPGGDYSHEFGSFADHERLAVALHASPATVLLSAYESELYDDLYAGWRKVTRRVVRRAGNGGSGALSHVNEVIWSNRPLDLQAELDLGFGNQPGV